jgi:acyl-coenzyme A synthetase/AMP-(fatty) acid ligase
VSSVELERVVLEHLNRVVLEAAAVGVPTPGGGPELLHLFLVLHPSAAQQLGGGAGGSSGEGGAQLQQQCQAAVRTGLNPLFKVDKVSVMVEVLVGL